MNETDRREIALGDETFRPTADMGWLWIYDLGSNYDFPLAFDSTINTVQPWRRLSLALEEIERLRNALAELRDWDCLTLRPDGSGEFLQDARWAREVIAEALGEKFLPWQVTA